MTDTFDDTVDSAIALFRVRIKDTSNPTSRKSLEQATDSFNRFLCGSQVPVSGFNETLVSEWVSWLFSTGYTYKTVVYYVNRLSSLYGKVARETGAEGNGGFTAVKEKLRNTSETEFEIYSTPDIFNRLRRLVLADYSKNTALQLAKDLVLFSLYTGGLTFDKLARYKKDDYLGDDKAVSAIIERYAKAKNKYLFPLKQSEHTASQLKRMVSSLFSDALKSVDIRLSSYTASLPVDLWAITASRCGISAADIAGCIGSVDGMNPVYPFAVGSELSAERKTEIRYRVSRILSKDSEDWYAMQFRPHVDYGMIQDRMKSAGITFSRLFYPMEDIIRRVGKKLRHESRPVIPGLLFFRSKATDLPGLYFHIGDLAWGYRCERNARSSYAVIPQKEIELYEKAVGKFIDSMDEYPQGTFRLEEGDKVEITGGQLRGRPAIFEKEIRKVAKDGHTVTRITNRLRLAGIQNFSWIVELDPRSMKKISDKRFEDLRESIRKETGA